MAQPGAQSFVVCGSGGVDRHLTRHRIVGEDHRISTLMFEMVEPPPVEAKPPPRKAAPPLTEGKKKKPARPRKRKNKNPRLR